MLVCRALQCKITSFIFYIAQVASLNIPVSTLMPCLLFALPAIKLLPLKKKKSLQTMLNTFHWFISMLLKQNVRVKVAVGFIPTTDLMHCAASVIKTDSVSPTIVQLEHCLFQKISHPYLRANKTLLHSKQCFMTTQTKKSTLFSLFKET